MSDPTPSTEIYLITPPAFSPAAFVNDLAAALDGGPVACLQLRMKDVDDDAIRAAAAAILPVAHARGVPVLMNDRPDLAAETGCDGVHIGQEDSPYAAARTLLGAQAMIGVTCHDSRHLAMTAAEHGADYVAFGAFFPSTTKRITTPADTNILSWWQEMMTVPCVAIGGITADNCAPVVRAGADFLAVVGAVWHHPAGPAAGVDALHQAIGAART
ncbi:MAG: thiamine phosphate synthase [Pseudomonadota bacterium]|nr:thiamine phosphate synthase [Pseudomonadota bacterium]